MKMNEAETSHKHFKYENKYIYLRYYSDINLKYMLANSHSHTYIYTHAVTN